MIKQVESNACECGNHYWSRMNRGFVTLISPCDKHLLTMRWTAVISGRNAYAINSKTGLLLHRLILAPPEGYQTDHINWNGLDNRRQNLRPCLKFQNKANSRYTRHQHKTSQFRGVSRHPTGKKWTARISIHGDVKTLGNFDLESEAARAYDIVAAAHFKEFAVLNFPQTEKRPATLRQRV